MRVPRRSEIHDTRPHQLIESKSTDDDSSEIKFDSKHSTLPIEVKYQIMSSINSQTVKALRIF